MKEDLSPPNIIEWRRKAVVVVKEFNYQTLEKLSLSYDLLNMFTKIHEYKGKQELYIFNKPEILSKLTDLALI